MYLSRSLAFLFLLLHSVISLNAESVLRTWKDSKGKQYQASILGVNSQKVTLRDSRGVFFQLSRAQLSAEDQKYVSLWVKESRSQGKAQGNPFPSTAGVTGKKPKPQTRPKPVFTKKSSIVASPPQKRNKAYDLPWPKQVTLDINFPIEIGDADNVKKRWVYNSPNFEFISNVQLGHDVIRNFAWMFEATYVYCSQLPFNLERTQLQGQRKMRTYLFSTYSEYLRQGGIPGSAGLYSTGSDVILIPLQSLGVRKVGSKWRTSKAKGNQTLTHEITHQLFRGPANSAPWFIEGSAEYVSTIPFEGTRFLISHHQKAVRDYVMGRGRKGQGGWALGKSVKYPNLKYFMTTSYGGFQAIPAAYPYALMFFHYWAHMDGAGDGARLRSYVQALQEGQLEPEARKILLDGRTWEQLEKEFQLKWGRLSMRIEYVR